jgi:valyl-tRNA synthetase
MPFITEEIWHTLAERKEGETIMYAPVPRSSGFRQEMIDQFAFAEEVITAVRNLRKEKNIPFKDAISLSIKKNNDEKPDTTFDGVVAKMCNISTLDYTDTKLADSINFIVGSTEFFIPFTHEFDKEAEVKKLTEELNYAKGFLASVMKKLSNEKFVNNASPAVVDVEKKKQADAEGKIAVLEEQIRSLGQ